MVPVGHTPGQPPRRQSRWLWWVYLGLGAVSCIGFVIVAVKVQRRKFTWAAVISVVACGASFASYIVWPPAEESARENKSETDWDLGSISVSGWIFLAVWFGLILYGHVLNRDYKKFLRDEDDENILRWHSNRARTQAVYAPRTAGAGPPPPQMPPPHDTQPADPPPSARSAPTVDPLAAEADRFLAAQPPGNVPASTPPNAPGA